MAETLTISVLGTLHPRPYGELHVAFAKAIECAQQVKSDADVVFASGVHPLIQQLVRDEMNKRPTAKAVVVLATSDPTVQGELQKTFGELFARVEVQTLPSTSDPVGKAMGEFLCEQGEVLVLLSQSVEPCDAETLAAVALAHTKNVEHARKLQDPQQQPPPTTEKSERRRILRIAGEAAIPVCPGSGPGQAKGQAAVHWLIEAHDRFDKGLSQAERFVCKSHDQYRQLLKQETDQMNDLLRRTFSEAHTIVVVDRLGGYSGRGDRHVLRVEVHGASKGNPEMEWIDAKMVKIGPCTELCQEFLGRKTCERSANASGRTLLEVERGVCPNGLQTPSRPCPDDPLPILGSIVYQDAYHTLRAARVVSLETAFLNSVRLGTPSPHSILVVLDQVYQELQNHCYDRAPAIRPVPQRRRILEQLKKKLEPGRDRWTGEAQSQDGGTPSPSDGRCQAREMLPKDLFPFVDLANFYTRAFRQRNYQPEMRFGRAHGDIHGRNIVVGLVDGEARWPAVFDFEDMGTHNFVAWDFVKLEIELKIRALPIVFSCVPELFVTKVWEFEQHLNRTTEEKNADLFDSWRDGESHDWLDPASRLFNLLLGLRRRAKRYLQMQGPPRFYRWLHEYYFFLACYGIYAGKFQTYTEQQWLATYVAASCAATRYVWGVERVYLTNKDGEAKAQRRSDNTRWGEGVSSIATGAVRSAGVSSGESLLANSVQYVSTGGESPNGAGWQPHYNVEDPRMRWDVRLAEMQALARSKQPRLVEEAVAGLRQLKDRVPAAAEVVSELAYAYIELARLTKKQDYFGHAAKELLEFEERQLGFYSHDTELLSRAGRIWKDVAEVALTELLDRLKQVVSPSPEDEELRKSVVHYYRVSASYYGRSYEADRDYYPGINLATIQFVIGSLDRDESNRAKLDSSPGEYRKLAQEIKEHLLEEIKEYLPEGNKECPSKNKLPKDGHWRMASLGEACLLLEQKEAIEWYKMAWNHKEIKNKPSCQDSIRTQAKRIMTQQAQLNPPAELRQLHEQLSEVLK